MDVEIRNLDTMHLATVRHVGPYFGIGEAFQTLHQLVRQHGLLGEGPPVFLGVYYDDPDSNPPEGLRSDAALQVPEGTELPEGLKPEVVPGGRFACYPYAGPYEGLAGAWGEFGAWFQGSGETAREGGFLEFYVKTPMEGDPNDLLTELYIPLQD